MKGKDLSVIKKQILNNLWQLVYYSCKPVIIHNPQICILMFISLILNLNVSFINSLSAIIC